MSKFRTDIEGLRAVAILLVIGYHFRLPGFNGGFIGVDIFFVLSGYLITSLLVDDLEKSGSLNLVDFYARRARRLLPASLTMILFVSAFLAFYCGPFEQRKLTGAALYAAAYLSNVYFAKTSVSYLDEGPESNPFLHTWSLSVEEQFYFAWPLILILIFRISKQYRLAVIIALSLLLFIIAIYLTKARQPWAFFLSPPRAWEFLVGAIAYWHVRHPVQKPVLGWLALIGLLAIATIYNVHTSFPGVTAFPPVICTAVLLCYPSPTISQILSLKPFQYIGRLSYSWYLWHWPVLVLGHMVWAVPTLAVQLILAVFSLLLAQLSYSLIECPIRFNRMLNARPGLTVTFAVGVTVCTCITLLGWRVLASKWEQTPGQQDIVRAIGDLPPHISASTGCDTWYHSSDIQECRFGAPSEKIAVLLGDSIASQWVSAVELVAKSNGWQLLLLTKSSCPMVAESFYNEKIKGTYTVCDDWRNKVLARLVAIKPDLVIVSMSSGYPYTYLQWQHGLHEVFTSLSQSSKRLVLLRENPPAFFNVATCLSRSIWRGESQVSRCSFDAYSTKSSLAFQAQKAELSNLKNAEVLDLTDEICPEEKCVPMRNGIVTYRDGGHLTNSFVTTLAAKFQAVFRSN